MNKGLLLLNLGTPDNTSSAAIYRYLTEFLNDPLVIDLPLPVRFCLVNLIIIPFRYKKTQAAYQAIWQSGDSSPLLINSQALEQALSQSLKGTHQVALGMRYGNPSIETALKQLKHCRELTILPLFPQYSTSATHSAIKKVLTLMTEQINIPKIKIINQFYNHPGFIKSYSEIIKLSLNNHKIDHLLFSFHGLPLRHVQKNGCDPYCTQAGACPLINDQNFYCYRAQCFATTRAIAKELSLPDTNFTVTFQSRLGKTPWIKPYTDYMLPKLIEQGIKNIGIVCPSFVADCLETLEEINIRAREQWQKLGGETFTFIPCLNDHPTSVQTLSDFILKEPE